MTIETNHHVVPHVSEAYEPGAILEYSWGYDQTNIDFFVIVKTSTSPKGVVTLTLAELSGHETGDGWTGKKVPGGKISSGTFRRKLHFDGDRPFGVAIRSYGWCALWDGQPSYVSHYA